MAPPLLLSLADGAWIFLAFVVVWFLAVAYGYYSRSGSAINQRPQGAERRTGAGVGAGPSRISSADDETEGVPDTHGTR